MLRIVRSMAKGLSFLAVALASTTLFSQTLYSNSFEYADWDAAVADGWSYFGTNQPTISFPGNTQGTGASPTDGSKMLEIVPPTNGGIRNFILDEDIKEYVISFDWYVVNPSSSVSGGTGSKGYNSYFQLLSSDLSTGVEFRAHHFNTTVEIEPGVNQLNARALNVRRIENGAAVGGSDHTSYTTPRPDVIAARYFQSGWNHFEIYASEHPDLGGDWLRFYLNGEFVGESNVNWFGWNASFGAIGFGWTSLAGVTNNASYFDNFTVTASTVAPLSGDHNGDGRVDAADYVVWRKNGIDGEQGYLDWRANFGASSSGGSSLGATAAVPEPAVFGLVLLGLLGTSLFRRAARATIRR